MNRSLLVALAPVVLGIAAIACNGRVATDDPSGSSSQKSQKGDAEQEPVASQPSKPAAGTVQGPAKPACSYEYGSSSGGGDGHNFSCESTEHYTCNGGPQELTCSCASKGGVWGQGTCSCNGQTFTYDCANGCLPGPAEYAKCNLPEPDDTSPSGGSSGWGSSSSSSSSSSGG